ncbi:hypothetical protein [Hyalangium rubrum]|uniref:Cytochrome c domain-containing protein n=1 Tax=Hyalangium rubrum TaxID=3103134 RepID=A0ABU5H1V6_9BACT|nr:hypothetical protein [Hyalangium sp. s54d21]MDY7227092.1 hypothetical protein [Hyalangium sp. s54d21]
MKVVAPVLLLLVTAACGDSSGSSTLPLERPQPTAFQASQVRSQEALASGSGFADQTGGGIFVSVAGAPVRLRLDGSRAPLEGHPGNAVAPGKARAAFRLGPRTALVETETGLFLADAGWLIAPPWRDALGPGLVATAQAADGAVWLAHTSGLYRLHEGKLSALKVDGAALEGITVLAAAPAEDGAPGVWLLKDGKPYVAVATAAGVYQVRPAELRLDERETLVSMAGLEASKDATAELWVLTSERLLRHKDGKWRRVEFAQRPVQLLSAGRFLWVKSSDQLLLYDADADSWGLATGVETREFRFVAADESGSAWVQLGAETVVLSRAPVPRVLGLHQGMRVVEDSLLVRAVPPAGQTPTLLFRIGGAEVVAEAPGYSLGGLEKDGELKPYSFAALEPGKNVLELVARFLDGSESKRLVYFDFQPVGPVVLGWDKDIRPIHEARCAKCHISGPGRQLSTYELWKENAELITAAVRDQRMPADGPLDQQLITLIQRWAASGAKP